jgi:myo-inositol-hexaphosphate 3-phosphohydrolase
VNQDRIRDGSDGAAGGRRGGRRDASCNSDGLSTIRRICLSWAGLEVRGVENRMMQARGPLQEIRGQRVQGFRGGIVVFVLALASILGLSPIADAEVLPQPVGDAQAIAETAPVANSGDAADDVAIWRDPANPARSIVIGNDKLGALEVYDMSGALIQRFDGGFYGNVDTRAAMQTGVGSVDIAVTYRLGIRVFGINPATRQLSNITDGATGSIPSPIGGEGICLYRSAASGRMYVFANARDGRVAQFSLTDTDADGLVEGTVVRQWDVGAEVEGCVADDALGHLYISEEDVAIWKYGAEPTAPTDPNSRVAVDRPIAAGGHFRPDAEGLTLVYLPGGDGYLIASSQAGSNTLNSYLVYDRLGTNPFIREFRVVDGPSVDGCGWTDGIDALAADMGPGFHRGVFICQDNNNTLPGSSGNQNFKFVPLERVVGLPGGEPPPAPGTVKMVVADPSALIAGEIAIRDRLTSSGYTVSIVNDNTVVASDANDAAFVFVSSTVSDGILGAKLRNVPQPVWIAKPYSLDNMLMTGTVANVDYGTISTDSVTITDATHPLAAGQTGTVLVTPTNKTKSWGLPGPAADVVATAGGKATTFVYQPGDPLVGGTIAPGCRLTSPAFQGGPTSFTPAAWAMFDAAASYAATNCESLAG